MCCRNSNQWLDEKGAAISPCALGGLNCPICCGFGWDKMQYNGCRVRSEEKRTGRYKTRLVSVTLLANWFEVLF